MGRMGCGERVATRIFDVRLRFSPETIGPSRPPVSPKTTGPWNIRVLGFCKYFGQAALLSVVSFQVLKWVWGH